MDENIMNVAEDGTTPVNLPIVRVTVKDHETNTDKDVNIYTCARGVTCDEGKTAQEHINDLVEHLANEEIHQEIDPDAFAAKDHKHDDLYAAKDHNHSGVYALTGHNHDGTYALASHQHPTTDITGLTELLAGCAKVQTGSYVGTGSTQTITCDFALKVVFVYRAVETASAGDSVLAVATHHGNFAFEKVSGDNKLVIDLCTISGNTFTVRDPFEDSGIKHFYIAIG